MRNEYPRPDFKGDSFISLNGKWDFDYDDKGVGLSSSWFKSHRYSKSIEVPFCFQSQLSTIGDTSFHDNIWYHKEIDKPSLNKDKRLFLHFEGVDYEATVFMNGCQVGKHIGSNAGFKLDITDYLKEGKNDLVVFVFDPSKDRSIPRGKQDWEEKSHSIFYTRTSGIYKSAWMEIVNKSHVSSMYLVTNIEKLEVEADTKLTTNEGFLTFVVSDESSKKEFTFNVSKRKDKYSFILPSDFVNGRLWDASHPYLFNLDVYLKDKQGNILHHISSYFGLREVSSSNGVVSINKVPTYLKLVLNQGYYPGGLLTAPSIEELEKDIDLMKQMGFNGCRIHQKCEDSYFLYLCDKKGFYLFQECASSYEFDKDEPRRLANEWIEIVKNNYNHPSIIAYTPLNESWGVEGISSNRQIQSFANMLYYLIHSLDETRLVISNDGWEQCKTDLITIHNYSHGKKGDEKTYQKFIKALSSREEIVKFENINKLILNPGYKDEGQPILLSEFGGIAFNKDTATGNAWGYTTCLDSKDYIGELTRIYKAIEASSCIVGICYTQLTDVEQEVNGLLTFDRKFKADPASIKALNDSLHLKLGAKQ